MEDTQQKTGAGDLGDARAWVPRLEALLGEQRGLCTQLDRLSQDQGGVIRGGDTDGLMKILSERQSIVNRIVELNTELEPFRRQWETCIRGVDAAERERLEAARAELAELVDRIWSRDEQDRADLERQRAGVAAEITGVSRTRVAVSAYAPKPAGRGPMFQDRSC